jgi:hypothetical protein
LYLTGCKLKGFFQIEIINEVLSNKGLILAIVVGKILRNPVIFTPFHFPPRGKGLFPFVFNSASAI